MREEQLTSLPAKAVLLRSGGVCKSTALERLLNVQRWRGADLCRSLSSAGKQAFVGSTRFNPVERWSTSVTAQAARGPSPVVREAALVRLGSDLPHPVQHLTGDAVIPHHGFPVPEPAQLALNHEGPRLGQLPRPAMRCADLPCPIRDPRHRMPVTPQEPARPGGPRLPRSALFAPGARNRARSSRFPA